MMITKNPLSFLAPKCKAILYGHSVHYADMGVELQIYARFCKYILVNGAKQRCDLFDKKHNIILKNAQNTLTIVLVGPLGQHHSLVVHLPLEALSIKSPHANLDQKYMAILSSHGLVSAMPKLALSMTQPIPNIPQIGILKQKLTININQ